MQDSSNASAGHASKRLHANKRFPAPLDVLRVPYAVLSLVYLAFLGAMPGSLYDKEQNARIEVEGAALADGTPRGHAHLPTG